MSSVLDRWRRGPSASDEAALRRNLAYVLHEAESSDAVTRAVGHARDHARRMHRIGARRLPVAIVDEFATPAPKLWLTVRLGVPDALYGALVDHLAVVAPTLIAIDGPCRAPVAVTLFRGEANLHLPDDQSRSVGVAALVLRPGARSTHLRVLGPFRWPDDALDALHALERLIQAHADQWLVQRALWRVPVEQALPGEIR